MLLDGKAENISDAKNLSACCHRYRQIPFFDLFPVIIFCHHFKNNHSDNQA